jgi:hypothetical protein
VAIMVAFKRYNKVGVIGKRFIIVIYNLTSIHINIFSSVVKDNELGLADIDRHLVGPKPECNLIKSN